MFTGIDRRMSRMFAKDGKSLTLAFDHGNVGFNKDGMAVPGRPSNEAIAAGADAILTTTAQALAFGDTLKHVGLAVNMDEFYGDPTPLVKQAMFLGADMGKIICYTGPGRRARRASARPSTLSAICRLHGLPLMIEPIPGSFENKAAAHPGQHRRGRPHRRRNRRRCGQDAVHRRPRLVQGSHLAASSSRSSCSAARTAATSRPSSPMSTAPSPKARSASPSAATSGPTRPRPRSSPP